MTKPWEEYRESAKCNHGPNPTPEEHFSWSHPKDIKCELIGIAKKGTKVGLVLASFNAG